MPPSAPLTESERQRLEELVNVVVAIAANDFTVRASVGDGEHVLDGLAAGLNMLSEEIEREQAAARAHQVQRAHADRLAAVGQLAAGVAHEINNPATYVLANLVAAEDALAAAGRARGDVERTAQLDQAREILRESIEGVERIARIVGALRNFATVSPDEMTAVRVRDAVDEASKLARGTVGYRAALVVHCDTAVAVRADRSRLVQVLTNLLLNAAQAIPEGAPSEHVVRVTVFTRDDTVVVAVDDSGSGIPSELQPHIFDPFFSTKPRGVGTGLGLSISAEIMRQHGGDLRLVQSSPQGTRFEATLPVATEQVADKRPDAAPLQTPQRARVFLIDDEPALVRALGRSLAREYDLETANNGQEAIERLQSGAVWDVIVCDLMMPGVDGASVHAWVSVHRPALIDRMLFTTGGAFTPRSRAFADQLGPRLLQKPLTHAGLRTAIAAVLAGTLL